MKKFLLSTLLAMAAVGISSAIPMQKSELTKLSDKVVVKNLKSESKSAATVTKLGNGVTISKKQGRKQLHAPMLNAPLTIKKAPVHKAAELPDGYVLFESFEGWDGEDIEWLPEGWSVEMKGEVEKDESWIPAYGGYWYPEAPDGDAMFGIWYSDYHQDEWLISPYATVAEGMQLSYWLYLEPFFIFGTDNVDWDTYEYIGEPEVTCNLEVYIQAEGDQEWTKLLDYAEEYKGYTAMELMMMQPDALKKQSISLSDYVNKKVRVAFRLVGTDGNIVFIDAIGIGYPQLEGISYTTPYETLYWGFDRSTEMSYMPVPLAMYPVNTPITWENLSDADATYTWTYTDPETYEDATSTDPYELNVTYHPDYTSEATIANNLCYPPTLTATAENSVPGVYQAPYTYFQAGGKPSYTFSGGEQFNGSLLPFEPHRQQLGLINISDDAIGAFGMPVFGYDSNVNQYWLNYSLNGEEEIEGDYARLVGIANLFMPSATAPIVIKGVNVYAYGLVGDDAEFTMTIYGLNSDMSSDISTFTKIASDTITGAQLLREDPSKSYLCLPFDFDTPVAITSTEEHPAYMIMLQGFNSDKVEYFAPMQSWYATDNDIYWGFMMMDIDMSNHISRPAYTNIKRLIYKVDDEYVSPESSFAFGLVAEYPWLTTDCEKIDLPLDNSTVTVDLGSYYDGSELTVEAPEGVTATVAGQYDKCKLTVSRKSTDNVIEGDIVVKGLGVQVSIPVHGQSAGIVTINANKAAVSEIYDLTGRSIKANEAKAGVYIVKYSDGSTAKQVVK